MPTEADTKLLNESQTKNEIKEKTVIKMIKKNILWGFSCFTTTEKKERRWNHSCKKLKRLIIFSKVLTPWKVKIRMERFYWFIFITFHSGRKSCRTMLNVQVKWTRKYLENGMQNDEMSNKLLLKWNDVKFRGKFASRFLNNQTECRNIRKREISIRAHDKLQKLRTNIEKANIRHTRSEGVTQFRLWAYDIAKLIFSSAPVHLICLAFFNSYSFLIDACNIY